MAAVSPPPFFTIATNALLANGVAEKAATKWRNERIGEYKALLKFTPEQVPALEKH